MKHIVLLLIIGIAGCGSEMNLTKKQPSLMHQIKNGRNIIITGQTITEAIDLVNLLEITPLNPTSGFVTVHSNIYFQDCTFKEDIIATKIANGETATQFKGSVAFINCSFEKQVNLRSAVFYGPVDFSQSIFYQGSSFQDAIFMQRATFNGTIWKEEGKFQQSRFYHTASFMDSRARGHMMFQKAVFRDDSNFSMSDYSKYVDFSLSRFSGKSTFNYVKWLDRAVLTNAIWRDDVSFIDGTFGSISLKGSKCDGDFIMEGKSVNAEYIPMD